MTHVTAVILAYGAEPWLERSVRSVLASEGVDADVVVVDNGCTDGGVELVASLPGVRIVRPETNLGFAGGCNAGAAAAEGEFIALLNGDAYLEPSALAHLVEAASRPDVGIATASVRLASGPDRINSAGNPVHFVGLVWSGGFGEPADSHGQEREVPAASGAGMALRTDVWRELGGFDETYFAYHEDVELSMRAWQRGLRVVYVPEAIVVHRYEFSRNKQKLYLMERNRLIFVFTLYGPRMLAVTAPALLAFEVGTIALATGQGWLPEKLKAWWWLLRHIGDLRTTRARRQAERSVTERELAGLFTGRFSASNLSLPRILLPLDLLLNAYWVAAKRLLEGSRPA